MTCNIRIRKFLWKDLEAYTHLFNAINGITRSEKAFDIEFMSRYCETQPATQRNMAFWRKIMIRRWDSRWLPLSCPSDGPWLVAES